MAELLARLKQRKLVQWALAYIAAAFALIQVLDVVASRFDWPAQLERIIILALAVGFVVVLVIAWYHGEKGRQRASGAELLLIALVLAIGGALVWQFGRVASGPDAAQRLRLHGEQTRTAEPARRVSDRDVANQSGSAARPIPAKSIAVLPLSNESGEKDQQYFSDGLSEDLINTLSQFAGLKVISRNSAFQFRDSKLSSAAIGQALGVAHLLEGSVQKLGDEVRINAELVNAADGSTLWSQHYNRPYKDLFALQDDITRAVADALKTKLLDNGGVAAQSERPSSGNLAAYSAYMQARYHFFLHTSDNNRKASALYEQAVRIDPSYARAYAELAITEAQRVAIFSDNQLDKNVSIAKARGAVKTALTLQPDIGVAHYAQAFILQVVDFDLAGAEREFGRAAELDPQNSATALSLGVLNASFGRLDQAVLFGQQAVVLDPLNSTNYIYLARTLIAAGRYAEAEAALRKSVEVHPQAAQAYSELAVVQILRGNPAAAVDMARQETDPFWRVYALALAAYADGGHAGADASLKDLIGKYADSGSFQIAQVYALRKQPDQMFTWLDHGLAVRDPGVTTLLYAPFLGAYRGDPRFTAICKKLGLPAPIDAKALP